MDLHSDANALPHCCRQVLWIAVSLVWRELDHLDMQQNIMLGHINLAISLGRN